MRELPKARVRPSSPFECSGVDCTGPINVRLTKTRGKGTKKGYIAIFICMATRAVHIELVEDYSSKAFIAAFHRFIARKGDCKKLYSDQRTNLVGADAQLRQMVDASSSFSSQVVLSRKKELCGFSILPMHLILVAHAKPQLNRPNITCVASLGIKSSPSQNLLHYSVE